jgi:hypothetical protein
VTATETTVHTVREKEGELVFEGEHLAHASSHDGFKSRWLEIDIYRTAAGKYVVAGCGRTVNAGEKDRPWAHVSDSPHGAVESLYLYDRDDVRYLTNVARQALREAGSRDPEISKAFKTQQID